MRLKIFKSYKSAVAYTHHYVRLGIMIGLRRVNRDYEVEVLARRQK